MNYSKNIGKIYKIPTASGIYCYAKLVNSIVFKFYKLYTEENITIEDIIKSETIFYASVHKAVFSKSKWEPVLYETVNENESSPLFFKQDIKDKNLCWIVDITGKETIAKPEECAHLDVLAVWDYEGIEERLVDYFEGRINKFVEYYRIKL